MYRIKTKQVSEWAESWVRSELRKLWTFLFLSRKPKKKYAKETCPAGPAPHNDITHLTTAELWAVYTVVKNALLCRHRQKIKIQLNFTRFTALRKLSFLQHITWNVSQLSDADTQHFGHSCRQKFQVIMSKNSPNIISGRNRRLAESEVT